MLFAKIISVAALVASAAAFPKIIKGNKESAIPGVFLVEFDLSFQGDLKQAVIGPLTAAGVKAEDIFIRTVTSTKLTKMISFAVNKHNTHTDEIISNIQAKNVFRVSKRAAPKPFVAAASTFAPEAVHSLTGVNTVREKLGLTGKGIKVAVIDSGVYYNHPALGGGFGPGFRVSYGYDLVGDDYSSKNPNAINPDNDPLDNCSTDSHGTHVAGIVGANAIGITGDLKPPVEFTGVAPEVTIGGYRVFGCDADFTSTDLVTAAIYRAAEDGSDIINLSLGGGPVFPDDADAYAAEVVGKEGHFVLGANGNDQAAGLYCASSPGVSRGGFGIASFDNVAINKPFLTVDAGKFPYSPGQNNAAFNFNTPIEIVVNDLTADELDKQDDGTAAVPTVDAKGKALLVRWGSTAFGGSIKRCGYAFKAGAAACIIYSNEVSIPGILGSPDIPSLSTTNDAGKAIIAAIKAGQKPTFTVTDNEANFNIPTAGTISDFSSPGLDPELSIKPDLGGIGGQVLSTVSLHVKEVGSLKSPYAVYSGTSMATPYTAGALALFLEARKREGLDFNTVRAYLQNTARPAKIFNTDLIDSVARQGAGLVNIYDAITTKTLVTPSALSLNDTKNTQQHYTISISNKNTVPVTYTLSTFGAALTSPFIAGDDATQPITTTPFTADYATVKFAKNNQRVDTLDVTVPAGSSKSVNVHFTAPSTAVAGLYPVYSGYINIALQGEKEKIASVPFAGVVGSWKDAPIWSRNSPSYAANFLQPTFGTADNITASTGVFDSSFSFEPLKSGATLNATDGIVVLPIAATNARLARVEVVYAGKDKNILPGNIRHKSALGYVLSYPLDLTTGETGAATSLSFVQYQRNSPVKAQSVVPPTVYLWSGELVTNSTSVEDSVRLPAGQYQIRFSGLKHFGRINAPVAGNDYDVVTSPVFNLVY
ncbi:hypothetical protein HDU97_004434 [Phlyctochytrium planicorne]|nr:hypothetical protein HDU97_004434 [Phlyctochytrium planicorne]